MDAPRHRTRLLSALIAAATLLAPNAAGVQTLVLCICHDGHISVETECRPTDCCPVTECSVVDAAVEPPQDTSHGCFDIHLKPSDSKRVTREDMIAGPGAKLAPSHHTGTITLWQPPRASAFHVGLHAAQTTPACPSIQILRI